MSVQQDWLFCRFHQIPIFELGLEMGLAIRLYALGFRTVGALDDFVGDYREDELFAAIGKKDGRMVLARLLAFCKKKLLEVRLNEEGSTKNRGS